MIISLRGDIDRHLPNTRPLSDGEWNLVQMERWGERCAPAGMAAKVEQWRDAIRPVRSDIPLAPKFRADPARKGREELLSYLFTLMASRLPIVESFRREVLSQKLLEFSDVEPWIQERARVEKYSVWLEVPVRPGEKGSDWTNRRVDISKVDPSDFHLKWLKFTLPGQKSQSVPTAAGGVLDRLRIASEHVASQTGCPADSATVFILSGEPLPFYSCLQTVTLCSTDFCSTLNRIELKIDPTLSPRQVAEVYRRLRADVFGRRYRSMSEKHIRLALFSWSRPDGETLKSAMAAWNKLYPKWRYRQESNFGRDRNMARHRALATLDASPTSQKTTESWLLGKKVEAESPISKSSLKRSRTR